MGAANFSPVMKAIYFISHKEFGTSKTFLAEIYGKELSQVIAVFPNSIFPGKGIIKYLRYGAAFSYTN